MQRVGAACEEQGGFMKELHKTLLFIFMLFGAALIRLGGVA